MILFSINDPANVSAYISDSYTPAEPVQLKRLPWQMELGQVVLTHGWEISTVHFNKGANPHYPTGYCKDFYGLYETYCQRVGTSGLSFEQWLSVLPSIGSGQGPADYVGLFMCQDEKHWLATITQAKVHLTELVESVIIREYKVMPINLLVEGARERARQRMATVEVFGQKLVSGEFLGDISWPGDQSIDMESFIQDYLLKE